MNKVKEFFNEHWEKVILGLVLVFCIYSLAISLAGILGKSNEQERIIELDKEIKALLLKGKSPELNLKQNAVIEFQKKFESREGFAPYQKLIEVRLFTEQAPVDPTKDVKDITLGHTSANASPGTNCERFFCKVKGENICLVCGAKGDREYKCNPPRLTDISTLRSNVREALEANPYLDRQKIRIIWEDDLETDRATFKDRKANVYRIEITEQNEKLLMDMVNKPTYQKDMRDLISNKDQNIKAFTKDGKIVELVGENVGGPLYIKPITGNTEIKKEKNENRLPDLFNPGNEKREEKKEEPVNNAPVLEEKMHRLHDEKVFFNFEDTTFEPLKRYRYVLLELFVGESATANKKLLNEWRFSKPVDVTTGAENIFYLSKVVPELDAERLPVKIDGKDVMNAEFKIYQYIRVQNVFYKKDFTKLRVGEEVGSFLRLGPDRKDDTITTSIKKSKTEFMKGTDLSDAEWAKWKEKYPNSMKARSAKVEIETSYFTGYKINEIGEEDVTVKVKDGPPRAEVPPTYDEKGNLILKQNWKEEKRHKQFVVLENTLTKAKMKIYSMDSKEIAEDLKEKKVKTIDDIGEDK